MRFIGCVLIAAGMAYGCDSDGGGSEGPEVGVLDLGGADARRPVDWDAGDGETSPPRRDLGPLEDAGVEPCWARGGEPQPTFEGEPIAGATDLLVDLDADGDGLPEVLVIAQGAASARLTLLDGRTLEPRGTVELPSTTSLDVMPGAWPGAPLRAPLPGGLFAVWTRSEAGEAVRSLTATDLSFALGAVALPGPAEQISVVSVGARAYALYAGVDGGCAVYDLANGAELMSQGLCRVQPIWDANGDGIPDLARRGGDGTTLLDGASLEPFAQHPVPMVLGPEAYVARGRGPEVIGVGPVDGRMTVHYLDPADLRDNGDAQTIALRGEAGRIEVHRVEGGQRIVIEEQNETGSLTYLKLAEPGSSLRPRGDLGPYRELWWASDADIDADGYADLHVIGGTSAAGVNTPIRFFRLRDADEIFTVPAERAARFVPALQRGEGGLGRLPDLDGCPGGELVAVREGNAGADGRVPTRLSAWGADGEGVWRSEGFLGRVHRIGVADLDGEGPAELLELRSEDDAGARLRVFTSAR